MHASTPGLSTVSQIIFKKLKWGRLRAQSPKALRICHARSGYFGSPFRRECGPESCLRDKFPSNNKQQQLHTSVRILCLRAASRARICRRAPCMSGNVSETKWRNRRTNHRMWQRLCFLDFHPLCLHACVGFVTPLGASHRLRLPS